MAMDDQAFSLLVEQGKQTHSLIAALRADLVAHYEADAKMNEKVIGTFSTIRTLKWVIGVALVLLTLMNDWAIAAFKVVMGAH